MKTSERPWYKFKTHSTRKPQAHTHTNNKQLLEHPHSNAWNKCLKETSRLKARFVLGSRPCLQQAEQVTIKPKTDDFVFQMLRRIYFRFRTSLCQWRLAGLDCWKHRQVSQLVSDPVPLAAGAGHVRVSHQEGGACPTGEPGHVWLCAASPVSLR